MTIDELVSLVEDLTDGMAVSDLRQGIDYKPLADLGDEAFATLIRFVGGERVVSHPVPGPIQMPTVDELDAFDQAMQGLDRDPDEPLELGGSFDGVSLP